MPATASISMHISQNRANNYAGLLLGGLTAGTLDISAALIQGSLAGRSPGTIFQSIASGVLGVSAFRGGMETAVLGFIIHFLIALGAAAIYYAASRTWNVLGERPILSGLLFGVAVYILMTFLVVPLSAAPFRLVNGPRSLVIGLTIHMLCIGLPIALAVRGSGPVRFQPA